VDAFEIQGLEALELQLAVAFEGARAPLLSKLEDCPLEGTQVASLLVGVLSSREMNYFSHFHQIPHFLLMRVGIWSF